MIDDNGVVWNRTYGGGPESMYGPQGACPLLNKVLEVSVVARENRQFPFSVHTGHKRLPPPALHKGRVLRPCCPSTSPPSHTEKGQELCDEPFRLTEIPFVRVCLGLRTLQARQDIFGGFFVC